MRRGFEEGAAGNIIHEATNKASGKSLRKLNEVFPQQLSVQSNLILDLAVRNGNFFKAHRKSNNEKGIFLVLYLAQAPALARWVVPAYSGEGNHPFLQNSPGLLPSSGPGAWSRGPSGSPSICGWAGLTGGGPKRKLLCARAIPSKCL